nr:EamA family transporter [Collinsella urealyticum]
MSSNPNQAARAARRRWRERLNDQASKKLIAGAAATLIGGACWGFSGTAASYLFTRCHVDVIWLMGARQVLAGALFILVGLIFDRKRLIGLWTDRKHWLDMLIFSLLAILMNQFAYLMTVQLTNPGTATIMQCLQLLFIMAFSCVHGKRVPRRREVLAIMLALTGTFLIATGGDPSRLSIPPLGLVMGLVTALGAALITILPGRILPRYGSTAVTGTAMVLSGLVVSTITHPWESIPPLDTEGWIAFAVLIVVGSFLAYFLYMHGVKEIGAMRAGLLGTIEPISATLTSALMLGTIFAPIEIVGFALIIAMVYLAM